MLMTKSILKILKLSLTQFALVIHLLNQKFLSPRFLNISHDPDPIPGTLKASRFSVYRYTPTSFQMSGNVITKLTTDSVMRSFQIL